MKYSPYRKGCNAELHVVSTNPDLKCANICKKCIVQVHEITMEVNVSIILLSEVVWAI